MKKIVALVIVIFIALVSFLLITDNSNYNKNYGIKSKLETDIKTESGYNKILKKKSVIIFVGDNSALSKKYAKEIDKISKDYNKEFYYYEGSNTKVIGIDKDKEKEEFNKKTKINSGIDKIFDDITSGACSEEEKC